MSSSSSEKGKLCRRKEKQHVGDRSMPTCRFRPESPKACDGSCKRSHSISSSSSRSRSSGSRSLDRSCSRSRSRSSSDISHRLSHRTRIKSNVRLCCCSRRGGRRKHRKGARNSDRGLSSSSSSRSDGETSSSIHRKRRRRRHPTSSDETDYVISGHASWQRRHHRRCSFPYSEKRCRHSFAHAHACTKKRRVIWSENFHKHLKKRKRGANEYLTRKVLKGSSVCKDLAFLDSGNKHKMHHHLHQPFCAEGLSSKSTFSQIHPSHTSQPKHHGKEMIFEEIIGKSSAFSSLKDSKSTEGGSAECDGVIRLDNFCRSSVPDLNDCSHEKLEWNCEVGTPPLMPFEEQQKGPYPSPLQIKDWLSLSLKTPEDPATDTKCSVPLTLTETPFSRKVPSIEVIALSSEDDDIPCLKISHEDSSSMDQSHEQRTVGEFFPHALLSFEENRYYQFHSSFSKASYTPILSDEDEIIECGDQKLLALTSVDPTSSGSSKASPKQVDIQTTNLGGESILDVLPIRDQFSLQESQLHLTKSAAATTAPVQSSVYYEQDSSGEVRLVTHVLCELTNECSSVQPKVESDIHNESASSDPKVPYAENFQIFTIEQESLDIADVKKTKVIKAPTWLKKGKNSRKSRLRDIKRNSNLSGSNGLFESYYGQDPDVTNVTMADVASAPIEISTSDDKDDTAGCHASNKRTLAELIDSQIVFPLEKKNKWETSVCCDLCGQGPSLSLGEWYAWCCGARWIKCRCSKERQLKLKKEVHSKARGVVAKQDMTFLSGAIHRMCALWSSEVYEVDDPGDRLENMCKAVKRGVALPCADPDCRSFGATLGCRVKQCRRSFHYPCADKLANKSRLRMWEGYCIPVACFEHLHFDLYGGKEKKDVRGLRGGSDKFPSNNSVCDDKLSSKVIAANAGTSCGKIHKSGELKKINRKLCNLATSSYFGRNLLYEDISGGKELAKIPCTNDVDNEPFPSIYYITDNRCVGQAAELLQDLQKDKTKLARGCKGCYQDMENPDAPISVHTFTDHKFRENDTRFDWQGQPMHARLPYDCYGRLQLGLYASDIVECNSRCTCGPSCCNRELQKGLQIPLEVFKTDDRGWAVRTLEDIPRGRFVVEYIGEILTQAEADQRAETHEFSSYNYPFTVDRPPEVPEKSSFVINGFKYSNVARFINNSCMGNLKIYKVYTEILDFKLFRIGMYAVKDIRKGEELSYNLKFGHLEPNINNACEKPSFQEIDCVV